MKKLVLIILALSITKISLYPVEGREGLDPIRAAEEAKRVEKEHQEAYEKHLNGRSPATLLTEQEHTQTITNLKNMGTEDAIQKIADIATDYAKQTPSSTRTNNLANFIDQTYTTARLSNPDNIKSILDGLDRLNSQFQSNQKYESLLKKMTTKIDQIISAIIIKVQENESYKQKLNSDTVASLFKNLDTMQDRKINITDDLNALVTTIPSNILVKALANQSIALKSRAFDAIMKRGEAYIRQLDGQTLTELLKTSIEIGTNPKSGVDLIKTFTQLFTQASPKSLGNALQNKQTQNDVSKAISTISTQHIHDFSKSQQIKALFDATQSVDRSELITDLRRILLENITDFSVFKTTKERQNVAKILTDIATQTSAMQSGNKEERQANIIKIIDRFITTLQPLNAEMAPVFNEFAALLRTIPSERAAVTERANILLLIGKKGFENAIQTLITNYINRKELPVDIKLNFLLQARKVALNTPAETIINKAILTSLRSITSAREFSENLFTELTNEQAFPPQEILADLMRAAIWKNNTEMAKIKDKLSTLLDDLTDLPFIGKMLASQPTKDIRTIIIDRLMDLIKINPDQIRPTFEAIVQNASKEELTAFFNAIKDELKSGQIWLMYMYLQSNVKNRINDFVNIIADKAQEEQWPISEFEKLSTEQYPLGLELLRKQSRPDFISTTYSLDWIDGINRLGLSGNDKAYFTKQQMAMLNELANRYETLTSEELTRLEKITTAMEPRIASVKDDPASLDHNLRILRKVNDVITERNWRSHWPILSSFIRFFKSFNLTAANALETETLLNNLKTKLEGFEQNKDVIDALKNIDAEIDRLKTFKK